MANSGVLGMGFWASIAFIVWYVAFSIAMGVAHCFLKDPGELQCDFHLKTELSFR